MDDMDKLKRLIEHWIEHNDEHEKTYKDWSRKALEAGRPEVAEVLKDIATVTKNMEKLFLKARKVI